MFNPTHTLAELLDRYCMMCQQIAPIPQRLSPYSAPQTTNCMHAHPAGLFNTRRDRLLAAVTQRCPTLLPMVAWAYGQHSRLLVQHSQEVVSSQSGVRQGDPLGPLLFALTLQGPLEQVAEMGLARPVAFADDTFLQGAREPTMRAFQVLTALDAPLGLCAQPDKCAVYSKDTAAAAASVATALGMHHAPAGLLAAGTPVGTAAFEAASSAT
jgi:hypothetical protein